MLSSLASAMTWTRRAALQRKRPRKVCVLASVEVLLTSTRSLHLQGVHDVRVCVTGNAWMMLACIKLLDTLWRAEGNLF